MTIPLTIGVPLEPNDLMTDLILPSPDPLQRAALASIPDGESESGTTTIFDRDRRGDSPDPERPDRDRLTPFGPAILAIRWATTMLSLSLAAGGFVRAEPDVVIWAAIITANTAVRSIGPLRDTGDHRSLLAIVGELGLHLMAVTLTGGWGSPFIFSLMSTVVVAGFARGFAFGLRIAGVAGLSVTLSLHVADTLATPAFELARWSSVVLLVGVVAGYGRRISGEANRRHSIAIDRMNRLADANALLFNLHRIAQTLPASLNQDEVYDSTLGRLRGLLPFEAATILTVDEADGAWVVARNQAMNLGQLLDAAELPAPARQAIATRTVIRCTDLGTEGPGFNPGSRSGLYAPLLARGALIGLLCVEVRDPDHFTAADADLLRRYTEPAALAIDNARWFARLRTVGADEERTRIARDLHDRIGQSLAYLGFELDRVIRHRNDGLPIDDLLDGLSRDLRTITGGVRETLYDLRTDVDRDKDLATTLGEFTGRVAERSNLEISVDCHEDGRLAILQEREIWRIAQEALINVERHAQATHVWVRWRHDRNGAELSIRDDGRGFTVGKAGRQDSYGLLGLRERASSIGATLEIESKPGEGTTVRCFLAQG